MNTHQLAICPAYGNCLTRIEKYVSDTRIYLRVLTGHLSNGLIIVNKASGANEESILEAVLEAGAEEVKDNGDAFEIICEASDLVTARTALQSAGIDYESADSSFIPSMTIDLDAESATKVFELIDAIEELDDVQNVFSNADVSDEVMASLA